MSAKPPVEPKVQTFNFKENETAVLSILRDSQVSLQRSFAALLSLVAVDRLGYPVTEATQFKLSEDFKTMEISERPDLVPKPDVPVAGAEPTPDNPEAPNAGVVAAK